MFRLLLRLPSLFELKFLTHCFLGPAIVPVRREFIARSIRIGLRGEPAFSGREGAFAAWRDPGARGKCELLHAPLNGTRRRVRYRY